MFAKVIVGSCLSLVPFAYICHLARRDRNQIFCSVNENAPAEIDEYGDANKLVVCLNNKDCQCACCRFYKYTKKKCIQKPWLTTLPFQVEERFVTPTIKKFYCLQTVPDFTIIDETSEDKKKKKKKDKKKDKKNKKDKKKKKDSENDDKKEPPPLSRYPRIMWHF